MMNAPSVTPPRSKNNMPQQLHVELSQFSSNPTPNNSQQNRINLNPTISKTNLPQYGVSGVSKPLRSKYP